MKVQIKNSAPNGPEGQLSTGRLRAVQCRYPALVPWFHDLRTLEQGKYEERKEGKEEEKFDASRWIYSCHNESVREMVPEEQITPWACGSAGILRPDSATTSSIGIVSH